MNSRPKHPIRSLLHPWSVLAGQKVASVKKTVEIISDLIAGNYPNIRSDELFNAFIDRESLGSTYVGNGLAIPHCRLLHCTQPVGVLMQLAKPILFDVDKESSTVLVFALVVPLQSQQADRDALASIADVFQKPASECVRQAKTSEDIYAAALSLDDQ